MGGTVMTVLVTIPVDVVMGAPLMVVVTSQFSE
jgi:hypothetical protein